MKTSSRSPIHITFDNAFYKVHDPFQEILHSCRLQRHSDEWTQPREETQ